MLIPYDNFIVLEIQEDTMEDKAEFLNKFNTIKNNV